MKFLIKILLNIINKCILKSIPKKQDIILDEEYITIKNINLTGMNNNNNIIISNEKEEDDSDDTNEMSVNDYRKFAEFAFINIFEIFAYNYENEGVIYFFTEITKDILPLLEKPINELNEKNILSVEIVIYVIKHISNCFEFFNIDKNPLSQFVLILTRSQILLNKFILLNTLLFIEEAKDHFEYNKSFFSELILFILNQISFKMEKESENSEEIIRLLSSVLKSICQAYTEGFLPEIWDKIFQFYTYYYDKFNFRILNNFSETLCSLFLVYVNRKGDLPKEMKIGFFKKNIEAPVLRIIKIGQIILNKNKENENIIRFEIIKNLDIISSVIKNTSFFSDKIYINTVFDFFYQKTFQQLNIIIKDYNKDTEIINSFMTIFKTVSKYITIDSLNSIYINFNEMMINSFFLNNENYHCIEILKNIYNLKLKNIKDKTQSNKEYFEIYNNFLKLIQQICSAVIKSSEYKLELMLGLSSFFACIFSQLNSINKEDYVIISDTIILLCEGIKTLREDNIINNILECFTAFVKSPNINLINEKFIDIIK